MTRARHQERARQLCNLVNVRRIQLGVEPLTQAHIMRAVRYVLGPAPEALFEARYPYAYIWAKLDLPINYVLTDKAKERYAPSIKD